MKKLVLIVLLATLTPLTAIAGNSVGCNVTGSGSEITGWTCGYTYTWGKQ